MAHSAMPEPVTIAILAKAPVPGYAKTRLIPALGPDGAAALQAQFLQLTVKMATEAAVGPVTLWCAPDTAHPSFAQAAVTHGVMLIPQPDGDLGARMMAAVAAATGPVIVIGTDCPVMEPEHLREIARRLRGANCNKTDLVLIPSEDGGYVAIGLTQPQPVLFQNMTWSTETVTARTLEKASHIGLSTWVMSSLWDVDEKEDYKKYIDLQNFRQKNFEY